jgi:spermidine synthase
MLSTGSPYKWPLSFLFFTAFVTGAIVMALEILGSRLLAPVFGNSLFVWGALIGVILAAMSSGYAFGGWLSDRHPGGSVLSWLLLGSGLWTLLLAGADQPVLFHVSSLIEDPRWGPCLAAAVLVAPPAFGLSGVLPALLRLAIQDMGHLGRHTGRMIAISTIGSLAGTWGTSFYLLSWLGTHLLIAWLGVAQVGLGILWGTRTILARKAIGPLLLAATAPALWFAWHPLSMLPPPVHQEDSPYQQVRVRDDDLFRYLILDRTFHAVMWRADPVQLYLPYSQMMMLALGWAPEAKRGLILGHGGGSLAKWLGRYWPEMELDTVEVDPSVALAAERYFEYQPGPRHHVHVKDARAFLQSTAAQYDIIWMDAFARHLIPFHLTTKEFFAELKAHLRPNGVVAVNLASSGEGSDLLRERAVVSTLRSAFPVLETYSVVGPWKSRQTRAENLIFFGGVPVEQTTFDELQQQMNRLVGQHRLPVETTRLWDRRRKAPWQAGLVLTDDYAPYDLLIAREPDGTGFDHSTN